MHKGSKICYFLWVITFLIYVVCLSGLIIKGQTGLALSWGIVGLPILVMFFFEIRKGGITYKILTITMLILIVGQAVLFVRFSFVDSERYIGAADYKTRYDYFTSKYDIDRPMSFVEFRSYALTVGYEFFQNKEIFIDENLRDDEIVGYLLRGLNEKLNLVNNIVVKKDVVNKVKDYCQTFLFYSDNDKIQDRHMYIYGGREWEFQDEVFFYKDNNDIYVIVGNQGIDIGNQTQVEPWISADSKSRYEWVKVDWGKDTIFDDISERNIGSITIIVRNLFYALLILGVGLIAGFPINKIVGNRTYLFMAFPLGTILIIMGTVLLGILRIPYTILSLYAIMAVITIAFNVLFSSMLSKKKKEQEKIPLLEIIAVFLLIIFCSVIPNVFTAYDSFMYNYLGRYIVNNQGFYSILGELSSFTFATPIINIGATLFKIDIFYAFQPVHTILGLMCIWSIQNEILKSQFGNKAKCWVISTISMALYISLPVFGAFTDWINNNILITIWLGISAGLVLLSTYKSNETMMKPMLYIAYPFFLIGNMVRIEGMLFGCIMLVCVYMLGIPRRVLKVYALGSLFLATCEYLFFCKIIGFRASEFWTPEKGGAMLLLLFVVTIVLLYDVVIKNKFKFIYNNLDYFMISGLLLGALILTIINLRLGIGNVITLGTQWFIMGYYGVFWIFFIFIILLILKSFKMQDKIYRFTICFSFSSITMIYILAFFRKPLHIGIGDSACRMVLHIIPIIGIAISTAIADVYTKEKSNIKG